ncbi:MAG: acyl-CoA dehydrogenase family protein [Flavobacteriales bacterium]|nr:acyl-CoA dehydrogenase family protein [Flavobacteriales bacterium]MDG1440867.1 acyl-CoA dehydrogenase family protein [Flavobacteriales bacterium]
MKIEEDKIIKGGEFLVKETKPEDVFIREEFGEEQMMMLSATVEFSEKEVKPHLMRFENKEYSLVEELMRKAGNLGLLAINVPEKYQGLGMGFNTGMLICEEISSLSGSIATAFGAHTGIGTLPILLYGNEEQKMYYLPKISSGEWMACYNLTEPDAGSDANSGKTKAVLTEDEKHYEITGQKIWISNAGFAHVFIVFARIENDKNITAFVFEKDKVEGLTLNPEEHKLGIRSSSTRQVFYNKVKVPTSAMLGKREEGFKIAMNALNVGRIKLGVAVTGASKRIINYAINYSNERKQFKTSISSFGAIQHKIAEMATKIYVADAANYRSGQNIENHIKRLEESGIDSQKAKLLGVQEYSIECAILKVFCSEVVQYVSDEAVQIYGGMGFSAESEVEAAYRDARISRIYEGTNEINRLLIVKMILKKGTTGEIDLMSSVKRVAKELLTLPTFENTSKGLFTEEKKVLNNLKKAVLLVAGSVSEKLGNKIATEQEVMMNIADMIIETYVLESALLKTEKLVMKNGEKNTTEQIAMCINFQHQSVEKISKNGKEALYAISEGDEQKILLLGLKRFTKINASNLKDNRRLIAKKLIETNKYCF